MHVPRNAALICVNLSNLWIIPIFLVLLIAVIQTVYFSTILFGSHRLEKADVIVVFGGREGRTEVAYDLAARAYAPRVIISPATAHQLKQHDRQFQPARPFEKIIEKKARTTFENALYTQRIIRENGFEKVILVTSWNHMPRSCLLLKMCLIGSGTEVLPHTVATRHLNQENFYRQTIGWKMVYNEMVETWGSLVETIVFRFEGESSSKGIGKSEFLVRLKKFLLFDIDLAVGIQNSLGACQIEIVQLLVRALYIKLSISPSSRICVVKKSF